MVGIKRSSRRNNDQHGGGPERRDCLAAERMALHDLDSKRERATLGPHNTQAHPPAVSVDVDPGNVAMHLYGSAIG